MPATSYDTADMLWKYGELVDVRSRNLAAVALERQACIARTFDPIEPGMLSADLDGRLSTSWVPRCVAPAGRPLPEMPVPTGGASQLVLTRLGSASGLQTAVAAVERWRGRPCRMRHIRIVAVRGV